MRFLGQPFAVKIVFIAFVALDGLLLVFVKLSLTFGMPQSQSQKLANFGWFPRHRRFSFINILFILAKHFYFFHNQAALWFTPTFLGEGLGSLPSNLPFFFAEKGPKLFSNLTF